MEFQVTKEDQDKISTFGKVHVQMKELMAQCEDAQRELLAVQDASGDALAMDEDVEGGLLLRVGECFFEVTPDEAVAELEKREADTQKQVDELQKQIDSRRAQLDELKHELYGKFGRDAINLGD